MTRNSARDLTLVRDELLGIERLFYTLPEDSPDRPKLMRRLAEGYFELETLAQRHERDGGSDAAAAAEVVGSAQANSIGYFNALIVTYPSYPKLDEAIYFLAYQHELMHDYTQARRRYHQLIDRAPMSNFIPNAYLAFGEMAFVEAMTDARKWPEAQAAYEEVVKYPAPENKAYGYGAYKLGYVYLNQGQLEKASNEFARVLDHSSRFPSNPYAMPLADAAQSVKAATDAELRSRKCRRP